MTEPIEDDRSSLPSDKGRDPTDMIDKLEKNNQELKNRIQELSAENQKLKSCNRELIANFKSILNTKIELENGTVKASKNVLYSLIRKLNRDYSNDDVLNRIIAKYAISEKDINGSDANSIPGCELFVEEETSPTVSIIIPVYNNYALTHDCIKSIVTQNFTTPYEIIVVDDCSTDATTSIEDRIRGIRVIRNEKNLGFLRNCNKAAKESNGKYILFLNNDTLVRESWLDSLVSTIENDDSIGMVGSKLLYPDGTLQEAGGIIWSDGHAWNFGNRGDPNAPEYNYVKDVDYISGASILVRKDLFDEINGFDERYVPAYCEDSDFAMELRRRNYRVVYQPRSEIVHFEGMSNGKDVSTGLKHYQIVNNEKFVDKWRDVLKKDHCGDEALAFFARDRSYGKKTILIIDINVPKFDDNAGNRSVTDYIRCFISMGMNVKLMTYDFEHDEYSGMLQSMGVEVVYGYGPNDRGRTWIKKYGQYIDFAFVFRPSVAMYYLKSLRAYSHAKIYYNVADLHHLRLYREYEVTHDEEKLKESEKMKQDEIMMMERYDVCVTLSSYEYGIISKLIGAERTLLAPVYCYGDCDIGEREMPKEKSMIFVGGFSHTPNIDAIHYLMKDIWPLITRKIPDIRLYIIGSNVPQSILDYKSENVIICGHVSDEELSEHYRNRSISVIPLRYGAGIKGKVIEAMYNKIPIVSTSVGLEGIEDLSEMLKPKDSPEDFADEVVSLMNDPERYRSMSESYIDCIRKHFSMESMKKLFYPEFDIHT